MRQWPSHQAPAQVPACRSTPPPHCRQTRQSTSDHRMTAEPSPALSPLLVRRRPTTRLPIPHLMSTNRGSRRPRFAGRSVRFLSGFRSARIRHRLVNTPNLWARISLRRASGPASAPRRLAVRQVFGVLRALVSLLELRRGWLGGSGSWRVSGWPVGSDFLSWLGRLVAGVVGGVQPARVPGGHQSAFRHSGWRALRWASSGHDDCPDTTRGVVAPLSSECVFGGDPSLDHDHLVSRGPGQRFPSLLGVVVRFVTPGSFPCGR
jgi:hypothetical protein